MTVLVADDDAMTRSTIAQLVKQLGHNVLVAEDGAEAGANDYIVKPVQLDALAEKLNSITV